MKSSFFIKCAFVFISLLCINGEALAQKPDFSDVQITYDWQNVFISITGLVNGTCDRCPGKYGSLDNEVSGRSSRAIKNGDIGDLFDKSTSFTLEVFRDGNQQIKAFLVDDKRAKLPVQNFSLHKDDQPQFASLLEQANNKNVTVFEFKPSYQFEYEEITVSTTKCKGKVAGTIEGLGVTLFTTCVNTANPNMGKPQLDKKNSGNSKGMKIKEH